MKIRTVTAGLLAAFALGTAVQAADLTIVLGDTGSGLAFLQQQIDRYQAANPGDHVTITAELIHAIAMEQGDKFAIREGGHTVGDGRISTIIE